MFFRVREIKKDNDGQDEVNKDFYLLTVKNWLLRHPILHACTQYAYLVYKIDKDAWSIIQR